MSSTTSTQDELRRELDALELLSMRLQRIREVVDQQGRFLLGDRDPFAMERGLIEAGDLGSMDDLDPNGTTVADYLAHQRAEFEAEYSALCWFVEAYDAIEAEGPEGALPIPSELQAAAERFPSRPGQTLADLAREALEATNRRTAKTNRVTDMLKRMLAEKEGADA